MRFTLPSWDRYGYLLALASVALATGVFLLGRDQFAKGQWALLYLLIVVLVAGVGGVRAAVLASVASFLAWNFFFLPPYGTFAVHDPKDWLSLLVFLFVGILMGLQTGRMREREADAVARERETALLYRLGADLVSVSSVRTMADTLLGETTTVAGASCGTLFLADADARVSTAYAYPEAHGACPAPSSRAVEWVLAQSKAVGLPAIASVARLGVEGWPVSVPWTDVQPGATDQGVLLPLQTASRIEGVLHIGPREDGRPYTVHEARLLVSAANLAAAFLERQRLEAAASAAEALREAERLKSTLVSSVSHELKTPLAAVTATVTSLLEGDIAWDEGAVRRELATVNGDLTRLNDSITALLDLSRLRADAWQPRKEPFEIGEVVASALAAMPAGLRSRITFAIPDDLPPVPMDFLQIQRAVQHLLENACAYSPAESPILVGANAVPGEVRFWVEDRGPGVPRREREHIFELFYRGAHAGQAPSGTGLGLAIAAEIVRFHNGHIWVEDVQPHGARFVIALPTAEGDTA